MDDIAFLTVRRKNGTVDVVSQPDGWHIYGRGKHSTMKMRIPRCTCCKHVCATIHDPNRSWSSTSTPTLVDHGPNEGHGKNHCHAGHVDRVRKIIDLVAKTYGPAVK